MKRRASDEPASGKKTAPTIEQSWLARTYAESAPFGKALLEGIFRKKSSQSAIRQLASTCEGPGHSVSESLWYKILRGHSKWLRITTIYEIAKFLDLDPLELAILYDGKQVEQANIEKYELEYLWHRLLALSPTNRKLSHVTIEALYEQEQHGRKVAC